MLASRPELSSLILVFAPFLRSSECHPHRRAVDDEARSSVEASPSDEVVAGIDGVALLGIFGSGEVAGVIIRLDNGERQRLPVGEAVKGWTLQSLEPRRAMLRPPRVNRLCLRWLLRRIKPEEIAQALQSVNAGARVSESAEAASADVPMGRGRHRE